jgi:hypothetical protein
MTKYPKSQICRQPEQAPGRSFRLRWGEGMVAYENLRANLRVYTCWVSVFCYHERSGSAILISQFTPILDIFFPVIFVPVSSYVNYHITH